MVELEIQRTHIKLRKTSETLLYCLCPALFQCPVLGAKNVLLLFEET